MNNSMKRGKYVCLSLCFALLLAGAAAAQTFTGTGFTITDGGGRVSTSCSTVTVAGVTGNRNVRSISLNSATHTFLGDLEIRAYPPGFAPPPATTGSVVLASAPNLRSCNLNGTYTFSDSAASSLDAATAGCTTAQDIAPGSYRTSTYGGGTNPGPVTTLAAAFGTRTPAQVNGNWLVCAFDFGTPDGGSVLSTSIQFSILTAGEVSVGGRVTTINGRGISKSTMTVHDMSGNLLQTALTNSFGYYSFDNLTAGESYTISVSAKGYRFDSPTIIYTATDTVDNLNFTANQ